MGRKLVFGWFWLCCSLAECVSRSTRTGWQRITLMIWSPNHTIFPANCTLYFLQSGREIAKLFSMPLWRWIYVFIQEMNHDRHALFVGQNQTKWCFPLMLKANKYRTCKELGTGGRKLYRLCGVEKNEKYNKSEKKERCWQEEMLQYLSQHWKSRS